MWMDAQPNAVFANIAALKTAFEVRYKPPDTVMYKNAKLIFNQRQDGLPVQDYVAIMQKLAREIGADERITRFAILNGLRPELQAFVIQRQPENIEDLVKVASMAELTCPAVEELESSAIARQLASMQVELKQATEKWDKLLGSTSAGVGDEPILLAQGGQTPKWAPACPTFSTERSIPGEGSVRGAFRGPDFPQRLQGSGYQQPASSYCNRCGRASHANVNYCPAVNQNCYSCGNRGHLAAMCRTALRARSQQQQLPQLPQESQQPSQQRNPY